MEDLIVWVMWSLLACFAVVLLIGFIGILFTPSHEAEGKCNGLRSRFGKAIVGGVLLGMWLDD